MMNLIKKLLSSQTHFFSHKEQKEFEMILELRKEKGLNHHLFVF